MSDHIAKAYDQDIASLKAMLVEMGGLAEDQLENAIQALVRRDTSLADEVIRRDARLDNLERQIEERAIVTIAKRQPMALDLREIMVAIRVASDIERIGDLTRGVGDRVGTGRLRLGALRCHDGGEGAVAFDFLADAIHHRHRFDGKFAGRRLR